MPVSLAHGREHLGDGDTLAAPDVEHLTDRGLVQPPGRAACAWPGSNHVDVVADASPSRVS